MDQNILSNLMAVVLGKNSITLYLPALFASNMQKRVYKIYTCSNESELRTDYSVQSQLINGVLKISSKYLALTAVANVLMEAIL